MRTPPEAFGFKFPLTTFWVKACLCVKLMALIHKGKGGLYSMTYMFRSCSIIHLCDCIFQLQRVQIQVAMDCTEHGGVIDIMWNSPRARGVLFVLKGPYDPRVPPIVKFSQESESARLTKIILSKSTVKTL